MRIALLMFARVYLVLAVLAGVPAGASRAVLCVAPDGHVAIEAGIARCADVAPAAALGAESPAARAVPGDCGDCDDCVDLPVGGPVLSTAQHGATLAPAPLATSSALHVNGSGILALLPAARTNASRAAASRPSFPPSRTTILRN
jgi:hypothetical protein